MRNIVKTLLDQKIHLIQSKYGRGEWIVFSNKEGKVLFQVEASNLFDADGNHFECEPLPERTK